ncbi:DUF2147 domain-containing protein [Bradyrhizobium sp. ARR65]|uniref:DUF2147 domain-containing protein n=1 Tax=Bradyrhizobium sp. ARR65 TaxID=1040989 RepID=UPI000465EA3D|nr:DUF2147 domain-containing protein [Bradyrhizobium sp. ARR65]
MKILWRIIIRTAVATLLAVAQNRGQAATPSDPSGTWLTEDGRARIRVEHCGVAPERICGYIVWMKEAVDTKGQPLRDKRNPDPAKRARALLGHQLILGLRPMQEGRFAGEIYNAEDGRTYGITIWRDGAERLNIRGCLLGLLCSTQSWVRTTDALPGQLVGTTGDATGPTPDPEWAMARQVRPGTTKVKAQ